MALFQFVQLSTLNHPEQAHISAISQSVLVIVIVVIVVVVLCIMVLIQNAGHYSLLKSFFSLSTYM